MVSDPSLGPILGQGCSAISDASNAAPLVPKSGKEALAKTTLFVGAAAAGVGRAALLATALGGAEAVGEGESLVADANKLHHIFSDPDHNLGELVEHFGSEKATFNAVQRATQAGVKGLSDVFETTVKVAGQSVTVRGRVIDGIARIGTFFIR